MNKHEAFEAILASNSLEITTSNSCKKQAYLGSFFIGNPPCIFMKLIIFLKGCMKDEEMMAMLTKQITEGDDDEENSEKDSSSRSSKSRSGKSSKSQSSKSKTEVSKSKTSSKSRN